MIVAKIMIMGDMSPTGLSHAYYNSPDGEPEDQVVDILGVYKNEKELNENIDADVYEYEKMTGSTFEENGAWVEIEYDAA